MKILAVSDVPSDYFFEYYTPGKLKGFDCILSCGDLPREYLEFLVTMAECPLCYVHGNHDESFDQSPPEGCICADGRIVTCGGLRILGLGGSYRYRDGKYMYTEAQMKRRVRKLWMPLKKHKGFDILLTHAPARGLGDFDTLAHQGFGAFVDLLDAYHPPYLVHGHVHLNYGANIPRLRERDGTSIINAYDHYIFEC